MINPLDIIPQLSLQSNTFYLFVGIGISDGHTVGVFAPLMFQHTHMLDGFSVIVNAIACSFECTVGDGKVSLYMSACLSLSVVFLVLCNFSSA